MFAETYLQNYIFGWAYAIKPNLPNLTYQYPNFLFKPNLTWHRAVLAETYSQNSNFGRAFAIKPNLSYHISILSFLFKPNLAPNNVRQT